MIFESEEEVEVEIQKGSTTNEERNIFGEPAPETFNSMDGARENSTDIRSECIWYYKCSGPFCVEA